MNNIKNLYSRFEDIKKMGWVKSLRKGDTGIGKTFEELLGKTEENFEFPDFEGIEIKTKRYYFFCGLSCVAISPIAWI